MVRDVSSTTFRKWNSLLASLRDGTKKGAVHWKATADSDIFLVSLKGAVILFGSRLSASSDIDYFVQLKNEDGDTVEEFTDVDLDREGGSREYFRFMKEMHLEIQRKFSGADEILDSVIQQLNSLSSNTSF